MQDSDCLFCKIIAGEIPSTKLYEDDKTIAIFDAFPNLEGQSLVIPKTHTSSRFEEADDEILLETMKTAKKVAEKLKVAFEAERIITVVEGLEIPHLHLKLFPVADPKEFSLINLGTTHPARKEMLTPEEFAELSQKYENAS